MKQAGLSGGSSGGGGSGGAASSGAAQGTAAVGGLNASIGAASPAAKTIQAGQDFSAGFKQGIDTGTPDAASAATAQGQASIDAINSSLDTASPSRILREIGRFFGIGFWMGIWDEHRRVHDTCHDIGVVAVQALQATSSVDAQNVGELFGKSLANGITSSLGTVKASAASLASAASAEATAVLGKMGLLGVAGSGASMQPQSQPITLSSGPAQQGQQHDRHCEHRLFIGGREIDIIADKRIERAVEKITSLAQGQKR
jgi:hypothetical protein